MLTHVALIDAVGAARPDVIGLLGTARYYALAAPFSFCRVEWCATRPGSLGFHVGLSAGACPRLRAIGVLLRYWRGHAPLTAKSPLPFPVGEAVSRTILHLAPIPYRS